MQNPTLILRPLAPEAILPYFHLEFGSEAVSLMLHLIYLCIYQFTDLIVRRTCSFFTFFNIICISSFLRSAFWISVILFNHFDIKKTPSMLQTLVLQFSLYMDIWQDQFWQCMIFLITSNSLMSKRKVYTSIPSEMPRAIIFVLLTVCTCTFFSLLLINDSQIRRFYFQQYGVLDSSDPSLRVIPNINRFFYIFTIGSFICCISHFFLVIRQQKNKTSPIGTSFVREHGLFIPLTITILLNSLCCLGAEYIYQADFEGNQTRRIVLVRVLSSADTLTKLSLPLMIVVSNCFYREKEEDQKSVEFEMT